DFEPTILSLVDHPQNQYQVSGLTPFSTYYWRVASIGEIGSSIFSDTMQFSTGALSESPVAPQLVAPANFASNMPRNVGLAWEGSYLAESYHVQIATNPYFSDPVVDQHGVTDVFFLCPLLDGATTYYWRVAAVNSYSVSNYSGSRRFSTGDWVDNEDELLAPATNSLAQNYPNPFNPNTQINFTVKDAGQKVKLRIYNTKGQLVRTLLSGAVKGHHQSLNWDGKNDSGESVSSGIYLYSLEGEDFSITRKMLLNK
ncbi:MAG: FlgD immunoglobulin-like domain containing protein, partial [Candidatus Cloacimonetes bacterium]|nr:FlgD immunoglobulin-like domain containing protein [Candidatus Cloacimonadota bacterium]MDD4806673.1 FlgD immunoglobulin-like domain containing protein [Candidatus Cloacimonadota bacterium]